jgi:hypothetical protein
MAKREAFCSIVGEEAVEICFSGWVTTPTRKSLLVVLAAALVVTLLAGCLPLAAPLPPEPSASPLPPTATATPTIVWFPPTATNTPLPTVTLPVTPTLDTRASYGALIYREDFRNPARWMLGRSAAGSVALGKSEISLVVTQPRGFLYSLQQEVGLGDFYLEITASPSICRGEDEYGLLLRVVSMMDYYRFGVNCRGEARVDRLVGGDASSPQPPLLSGAVPPGAPSTTRLAVWALGKELRFYANGQFLFAVRDPVLLNGGVGVYARATGPDSLTVNFSDLNVYEAQP